MHEKLQVEWPKCATMSFNNTQILKVKQLQNRNKKTQQLTKKLTQLFQTRCPFLADPIIRKRDLTLKPLLENNNNLSRFKVKWSRWSYSKKILIVIFSFIVYWWGRMWSSVVEAWPVALFPETRNLAPLCLSSPGCINGYQQHTSGG